MKKLLIALDYDGTYDADPRFWNEFIQVVRAFGHDVILATYRDERYDKTPLLEALELAIPVYYCRGSAKKWWMEQFAPDEHARPDIWIDDRPQSILQNSGLDRDGLKKWREDQKAGIGNANN